MNYPNNLGKAVALILSIALMSYSALHGTIEMGGSYSQSLYKCLFHAAPHSPQQAEKSCSLTLTTWLTSWKLHNGHPKATNQDHNRNFHICHQTISYHCILSYFNQSPFATENTLQLCQKLLLYLDSSHGGHRSCRSRDGNQVSSLVAACWHLLL